MTSQESDKKIKNIDTDIKIKKHLDFFNMIILFSFFRTNTGK